MQIIEHTLCAHDSDADTAKIEVRLEPRVVEINLLDDLGKEIDGAEVDQGYTRTVRLEVKQGVLKILLYPAMQDEPISYDLALGEYKLRDNN